jgi:hypothetical protein
MLTIEDIRNPARKSGFNHVTYAASVLHPSNKPYQADVNSGAAKNVRAYKGPRRATATEAAQDLCAYANGLTSFVRKLRQPRKQKPPALNLKRANHPTRHRTPTTSHSKRAATRTRPRRRTTIVGTVYLIGEVGNADVVKIGWSKDDGFARLRELQTGNHRLLCGIAERPGTKLDEYNMHLRHEADNVLNEWFEVTPGLLSEFDVSVQAFECAVGAEMETEWPAKALLG